MHKCHGKWKLIPELSFYQEGEPAVSCQYDIHINENHAEFNLAWIQQDGSEAQLQFGGIIDMVPRDVPGIPGAQASYTAINEQTLDSIMFMNGVEVAYARRVVSDDGTLMAVLQSNTNPSGSKVRITQVYRRIRRIE